MRTLEDVERCPASLRSLHRYWSSKHRGGALPGRGDIDPIELRGYLSRITLAELRAGQLVYRLVGTELVDEWGFEPTGRSVAESAPPAYRQTYLAPYQAVLSQICPIHASLPPRGRPYSGLTTEVIYLPLARDGRSVDMVLAYSTRPRARAPGRVQSARYRM